MNQLRSTVGQDKLCDLSLFEAHLTNNMDCECIVTGSIARSANCRYLIYSDADFEVFRPAGATRCTDGGEIWHGGGPLLRAKFHAHRCNDKGVGHQKLKFLLRFDQTVEYKRPLRIPCAIFTKFAQFVPHFRMR